MIIYHESLEAVLQKTESAVMVTIFQAGESTTTGFLIEREFSVKCEKILFGKQKKGQITCLYIQGIPDDRGEMTVSPLISGSGIELTLKKGDRFIFLLSSEGRLLRAEPLNQLDRIVKIKSLQQGSRERGVESLFLKVPSEGLHMLVGASPTRGTSGCRSISFG